MSLSVRDEQNQKDRIGWGGRGRGRMMSRIKKSQK